MDSDSPLTSYTFAYVLWWCESNWSCSWYYVVDEDKIFLSQQGVVAPSWC